MTDRDCYRQAVKVFGLMTDGEQIAVLEGLKAARRGHRTMAILFFDAVHGVVRGADGIVAHGSTPKPGAPDVC
jgi:hypothetical protein